MGNTRSVWLLAVGFWLLALSSEILLSQIFCVFSQCIKINDYRYDTVDSKYRGCKHAHADKKGVFAVAWG